MEIRAQNLTKKYGNKIAVDNVDLEIKSGKILALLGPNGAGKSTIIKMLTGRVSPTSGKIFVDDKAYEKLPPEFKESLGIMPQEILIWEDLNIKENLQYSADLYKLSKDFAKERINFLIEELKLEPELKTLARNLSGGYKRRLNLAISIIQDPKIIFLDEPTPGIDAQSRLLLTEFIQKLADTGLYSIVLTDHYLDQAEKLADYVVIVDNGKKIAQGTVAELKNSHGKGNILQIHLDTSDEKILQQAKKVFTQKFPEAQIHKQTIFITVENNQDSKILQQAIDMVKNNNFPIFNLNIKEPSLEDIFLLLTGKQVRE